MREIPLWQEQTPMPPEISAGSFPEMVDVVIVGGRGSRNDSIFAVFCLIRNRHGHPQYASEQSSAVEWWYI